MLLKDTLLQIINFQRENLSTHNLGLKREALSVLPDLSSHALIVSGVRRCGKSTLLFQLIKSKQDYTLYLNFEDPRLYEFEMGDFVRLDEIIADAGIKVLFFDEIQIVADWERYVRKKLDEGFKVVVTGSNASLLSRELGTKLTGRHLTQELFPFSYHEFLAFRDLEASDKSVLAYMTTGGFPEYVRTGIAEILQYLFDDILTRDIAVRHGIRDAKSLQRLALYLISNVSKPITANRLKTLFGISATSTLMEYLSHLEDAYLFQFVSKFSYSVRKQLVNPRKVYAIDTGLININSGSFSDDSGRIFENLVYLELRRKYKEVYYFAEKGECDFVVCVNGGFRSAIQVCYQLNQDNLNRELSGLIEALKFFEASIGIIVTLSQKDKIEKDGFTINVLPCHEWLAALNEIQ